MSQPLSDEARRALDAGLIAGLRERAEAAEEIIRSVTADMMQWRDKAIAAEKRAEVAEAKLAIAVGALNNLSEVTICHDALAAIASVKP